ncbi:MAG: DUF4418 family protein [Treponema sp.]|jgi:hypothetical protein|nr:DUF4418 family protein [Treponema sp.]
MKEGLKGRLFSGIPFFSAGLLIAFGPISLFPVCGAGRYAVSGGGMAAMSDTVMVCHWMSRAELAVGLIIAVLGFLTVLVKLPAFRLALSIAIILNAVAALLYPTVLIGVCGGHTMPCRLLTRPALIVFSILLIIGAAINALIIFKNIKKGEVK